MAKNSQIHCAIVVIIYSDKKVSIKIIYKY